MNMKETELIPRFRKSKMATVKVKEHVMSLLILIKQVPEKNHILTFLK